MSPTLPEAMFHRDGDMLVPTDFARGPWHEDSQHGSVMSGLLARALDQAPCTQPMQVTRLTIDLARAAPFAPLNTEVHVRHAGKSIELVEAILRAGDEVCARGHALRTRVIDLPVPSEVNEPPNVPALDESAKIPLPAGKTVALHDALQLSPVEGFAKCAMWVRMLRPLVMGETPSPLVRLLVALDWVYAVVALQQWIRDPQRLQKRPFIAINTDNHIALARPVEGEWVCLDASAFYGDLGAGVATARVLDVKGPVGFATQSLLQRGLDKRPKAWG